MFSRSVYLSILFAAYCLLIGCNSPSAKSPADSSSGLPAGMHEVKPHEVKAMAAGSKSSAPGSEPPAALPIVTGKYFSYALPPGWHVGEDGQFALTLVAPDNKALTIVVGNAGLRANYPPDRFAYEKLMALRPQDLRLGPATPATPSKGFSQAFAFDVDYKVNGVPCHGIAKVQIAPAYDIATMAMTAALSEAGQWPGYASWLPLVADQVAAVNGAAFGMRGIMAQNLQNSTAYAEAAKEYREWSQRNWQQVTYGRNASQDKNNTAFRENLGAVQTYVNPYDNRVPLELPTTYKHYWVNAQGTVAGTDDSSVNPNQGSTSEWKQLPLRRP